MNRNENNNRERKRCSELELEVAKLMESENQAREALERKYVEWWEDGFWLGADEGFERGYAQAVDDTTRRDLA